MLQIGEVSKISQVSLRMLRYYDKNNIFKPSIINDDNGYRYYSADQLDELYKIVELRDLGFSVAEIGELIKEGNQERYISAIKLKRDELEKEKEALQAKIRRLTLLEEETEQKKSIDDNITLVLKSIPDMDVVSYRKTVADYFCEGKLWEEFAKLISMGNIPQKGESFSLYHDSDYREKDVDIELCLAGSWDYAKIPEGLVHRQVIGCERAVSILVKGPYENISRAYYKFAHWLDDHEGYTMDGPTRQICHVSPENSDNPEEYVTEILIPLK